MLFFPLRYNDGGNLRDNGKGGIYNVQDTNVPIACSVTFGKIECRAFIPGKGYIAA